MRSKLASSPRCGRGGGVALSGTALLGWEAYVDAINKGAVLVISSAWQSVAPRAAAPSMTRSASTAPPRALPAAAAARTRRRGGARTAVAGRHRLPRSGGGGAAALEQQLVAAMADERKQLDALIGAQSTALCQKVAASVGDRLGRYAAASHASHAADLPAAIEAAIGEYAAGAAGAAPAEGLHALLTVACCRSCARPRGGRRGARAATAKTAGLAGGGRARADAEAARATAQSAVAERDAAVVERRAAVADADAAVGARGGGGGGRSPCAVRRVTYVRPRDATIAHGHARTDRGVAAVAPPAALSGGASSSMRAAGGLALKRARVEALAAVNAGGGDDALFADVSPAPLKTPGSRRCSVVTAMAVPSGSLKLGQGAKLPRKKDQLVALYNEHFAGEAGEAADDDHERHGGRG